jgi:hypothetical protein
MNEQKATPDAVAKNTLVLSREFKFKFEIDLVRMFRKRQTLRYNVIHVPSTQLRISNSQLKTEITW